MNSDRDALTPITDAPTASTNDVDREMDVIQPSGEHGNSTGVCAVAMETLAEKTGTKGKREKQISCASANSFPFLEIIVHRLMIVQIMKQLWRSCLMFPRRLFPMTEAWMIPSGLK